VDRYNGKEGVLSIFNSIHRICPSCSPRVHPFALRVFYLQWLMMMKNVPGDPLSLHAGIYIYIYHTHSRRENKGIALLSLSLCYLSLSLSLCIDLCVSFSVYGYLSYIQRIRSIRLKIELTPKNTVFFMSAEALRLFSSPLFSYSVTQFLRTPHTTYTDGLRNVYGPFIMTNAPFFCVSASQTPPHPSLPLLLS
jgi:hypothetical protein